MLRVPNTTRLTSHDKALSASFPFLSSMLRPSIPLNAPGQSEYANPNYQYRVTMLCPHPFMLSIAGLYKHVPTQNKPSTNALHTLGIISSIPSTSHHLCGCCGSPANKAATVLTAFNGSSPPWMSSSNSAGILVSCSRSSYLCPIISINLVSNSIYLMVRGRVLGERKAKSKKA